jgi:heme/copper-type cytochrome/quinol oxidase subunit 2
MPIEIKAVPREEFDAWVRQQGGTLKPEAVEVEDEDKAV